jgi:hypothetical protein
MVLSSAGRYKKEIARQFASFETMVPLVEEELQ